MSTAASMTGDPLERLRFMVWIDGVGAYLLCPGERVTVGGPADGESADVALLANLSRRHASFIRSGEGYVLEAHGPVRVEGRTIVERTCLNSGYRIELGSGVLLRFRLPSALSATAVLDFLSVHRPARSVDGVVLLEQACLLGPGGENHINCPDWPESVLLFRRRRQLWCKSRGDLFVDGMPARDGRPLKPGSIVTGADLRFRLEAIPPENQTVITGRDGSHV